MRVDLAELVVAYASDERDARAERCEPGDRVGARSAGDLLGGREVGVDGFGPVEIDHRGRPVREVVRRDEVVVDGTDDVDERVPDAENCEFRVAHRLPAGPKGTNATGASAPLPFPCGSSGGRSRRPIVLVRP